MGPDGNAPLDIVVNNAGIALDWTNVFRVFLVTKALLPLLRTSKHGRIINRTSGLDLGSLAPNADRAWARNAR